MYIRRIHLCNMTDFFIFEPGIKYNSTWGLQIFKAHEYVRVYFILQYFFSLNERKKYIVFIIFNLLKFPNPLQMYNKTQIYTRKQYDTLTHILLTNTF